MPNEFASIVREITAAENARREAIARGDIEALGACLADTFYYAHINGMVEERAAYLERVAANPGQIRATSARDLKVQPRKGYVLLHGKSRIETATVTVETLFLSVWERASDGWRITAYASTPLPK